MKWNKVLDNWKHGIILALPKNINKPFIWRCSVLDKNELLEYKHEFIEDSRFIGHEKQDLGIMASSLNKKKFDKEKYVVAFPNLNGDTVLVVPKERIGKHFTSIYYFSKNASLLQQKMFCKRVSIDARKALNKFTYVFISTHGLGIDYLHVRICSYPKYYEKSKLQKIPNILK